MSAPIDDRFIIWFVDKTSGKVLKGSGSETLRDFIKNNPLLWNTSVQVQVRQYGYQKVTLGDLLIQKPIELTCDPITQRWDPILGRCVPITVDPTPGGFLWTSKAWNNGLEKDAQNNIIGRHLRSHHQFDPYDNTFEVAAGENRDWFIDGKGKIFASGPRTRGYQHTKQLAGKLYEWIAKYKHNSSLENFSGEFFSRHNEPDPGTNRYGGPTFAFYNNKISFQEEYWHNERDSALNDEHDLSQNIVNGQETILKILGKKIVNSSTDVRFNFEIFVNGVKEWTKAFKTNHPEAAIKEALYYRWRVNGSAPKNVETYDWSIREIVV